MISIRDFVLRNRMSRHQDSCDFINLCQATVQGGKVANDIFPLRRIGCCTILNFIPHVFGHEKIA